MAINLFIFSFRERKISTDVKKFIIKTIYLCLPIILIIIYVEYNLRNIENSYTFKKSTLLNILPEIEVINFGSSHGDCSFDPDFYSYSGFNMANSSQDLYYDYHLFNLFFKKAKKLKVVIIPISYFSLGGKDLIETDEYWRSFFYKEVYGIPLQNNSKFWDLKRFSLILRYGSFTTISIVLSRFKLNLAKNYKKNGGYMEKSFELADFMKKINEDNGKARVEFHDAYIKKVNYQRDISFIERMIKICKANNIVPILITTPTYKTYYKNMNKVTWEITQKSIEKLLNIYNVEYFNYLRDGRFLKEDFRDNDHLNPKGAEKFSKIVNQEILMTHIKTIIN